MSKTVQDIFWEPSLQNIEELAHLLYGCMDARLMKLLGEEAAKHPKMACNLNEVSGESYGAMLYLARRVLVDQHNDSRLAAGE